MGFNNDTRMWLIFGASLGYACDNFHGMAIGVACFSGVWSAISIIGSMKWPGKF